LDNAEVAALGPDPLIEGVCEQFFTTTNAKNLDTVAADKTHRGHAIIEQVNGDLKACALAHLPSGKLARERSLPLHIRTDTPLLTPHQGTHP
jgi:hypothetical protein